MRFSTIAAFATSLVVVSAQTPDLSNVPNCAIPCLVSAIPGSGCGVTDVTCQCTTGQSAITSSLESCLPSKCSSEDLAKVAPALAGLCSAAGISVSIPASAAATSAASAASSAAGSMMTSAASAASSAVASARSSAASMASSAASRASGAASATSSGPAQSTGGAAANAVGLGAVALGMFAALF
ncbi:hypothetical protein E8E12_001937 [Didymella heteroderae]|uniref:CFEM domain-containing protein n=1 Tax=Didymella heteroderae TaxID=1769908 RepID=A0A9P4WM45_9PLEO|nr:hypothetical protein E8E12_001937 [Didymella heteroderae]